MRKAAGIYACAACSFCDNTATNLAMMRPIRIWARNNYQATICYRLFFCPMESMCNTSLHIMVLRHKISVLITASVFCNQYPACRTTLPRWGKAHISRGGVSGELKRRCAVVVCHDASFVCVCFLCFWLDNRPTRAGAALRAAPLERGWAKTHPRRAFGKRPPAPRNPKGKPGRPFVGAHGGGAARPSRSHTPGRGF